jgi:hypothetical protein
MMTWHPTDEDLILHFYGESRPADGARIDGHLKACVLCRSAWSDLGETLRLVDAAGMPEPDAGFERVMWARVREALPPAAPPRMGWSTRWLAPALGLAAVVVALLSVGVEWRRTTQIADGMAAADAAVAAATRAGDVRERVLLTALDSHFEQTEMLLVELSNAPEADEHEMAFERETADELVASGRLYRVTAAERGDVDIVRMLEDLESVLVDVARGPATIDRSGMASLRARIDDDDLLFKVRAVNNQIRGRQQALFTVSEGPL